MSSTITDLADALTDLSDAITKQWGDDRTLTEAFGWNHAPLTRHDLAFSPKRQAQRLLWLGQIAPTPDVEERLKAAVIKINLFKTQSLPNLFNGNSLAVVPIYSALLAWVEAAIQPLFTWQKLQDLEVVPADIRKRLRSLNNDINLINSKVQDIVAATELLVSAKEAAQALPTDLQSLVETRKDIANLITSANEDAKSISKLVPTAEDHAGTLAKYEIAIQKILAKCHETLQQATSNQLASAFETRAKELRSSVNWWVALLIFALGCGIYIGHDRVIALDKVLSLQNLSSTLIFTNLFIAALSLGAPLWISWLATTQIGQRFRLAEDYAFKASISKAYDGYRQQAEKLDERFTDENFAARLFGSAITRLDEPPLSQIEKKVHASPWHQLIASFGKKSDPPSPSSLAPASE